MIKRIRTGKNPALAGPLVNFQATIAQIRGPDDTPNQPVRYSNPEHLNSFICFGRILPHNTGNLIKTEAALLAACVSKITSCLKVFLFILPSLMMLL